MKEMAWEEKIIKAHTDVTDQVSHFERLQSDRYFVWQEEATEGLFADNRHRERAMRGTTDLFTKYEFDPWRRRFEKSLSDKGIPWELNSIQYEPDTGFIHYEWIWYVTGVNI